MHLRAFFLTALLGMVSNQALAQADSAKIAAAKAIIASHEVYAASGDLEGVVSNVADDVVGMFPGTPLIQGKTAFREFYAGLLKLGSWKFTHDYTGAAVDGDLVFLDGVSRGTLTPANSAAASFANNFMFVLKLDATGRYKILRGATGNVK